MAKTFKLGQRVQYTDGNGYTKAAQITGTRESIKAGTDVVRPEEGAANLRVISPKGKDGDYDRTNVAFSEVAGERRTFTRL
jgi:hypothetical protein